MFQVMQGAQMLFVAFGALVLVPLLTGLDPNVALFGAGIGTSFSKSLQNALSPYSLPLLSRLLHQLCTVSRHGAYLQPSVA